MNHHRKPRSRFSTVTVTLALLLAPVTLTACTLDNLNPGSKTTTPDVERRDPTNADMAQLRTEILDLPHVTNVELTFNPGSFGNASSWEGLVTVDTTERELQLDTLRKVLALLWGKAELVAGAEYAFAVGSGENGVNGRDLGYSGALAYPDLEELFGPRPIPTPTS